MKHHRGHLPILSDVKHCETLFSNILWDHDINIIRSDPNDPYVVGVLDHYGVMMSFIRVFPHLHTVHPLLDRILQLAAGEPVASEDQHLALFFSTGTANKNIQKRWFHPQTVLLEKGNGDSDQHSLLFIWDVNNVFSPRIFMQFLDLMLQTWKIKRPW